MKNISKSTISVIIPTYNRAEYIGQSIESVLGQKGDWQTEIIVVDDGSTDNTQEVLKKFAQQIKYFKIKHTGRPAPARNKGLQEASGELVAFLDSDDLWTTDKLNRQIPLFEDPKIIFSYSNAEIIDSNGKKTGKRLVDPKKNQIR